MNKEEFIAYFNAHDTCSAQMGIRLLSIGEGCAEAELPVTDRVRNIMGGLHGGALATLADIVAGCAMYHHNRLCVTLDSDIHYLKGIGEGTARAVARELHGGGRTGVSQVEIRNEAGELCCCCTVTMYLKEKPGF